MLLAVFAIGAAGCGSSSKSSTTSSATSPSATTKKSNATKKSATTKTTYRAGEFCTVKKSAAYKAQGLKCVKVKGTYRLEKG